jgi:hypothetical protein
MTKYEADRLARLRRHYMDDKYLQECQDLIMQIYSAAVPVAFKFYEDGPDVIYADDVEETVRKIKKDMEFYIGIKYQIKL